MTEDELADELLGFPSVVEGLRRACLLSKETEPREVVAHLRRVTGAGRVGSGTGPKPLRVARHEVTARTPEEIACAPLDEPR